MLPPLFPADDDFNLIERLTLPASVQTVLRKTKIVSKFVKLLFMRREVIVFDFDLLYFIYILLQ